VPTGKTGDPLVDFLTNKIGFCQQYAAAMGVMLRLAGVPSRVVLGYAHAAPNSDGDFTITTNDAHAWDEAYFEGIGWIPFDPTPLTGITDGAKNDLPWAQHANVASPNSSSSARSTFSRPNREATSTHSTGVATTGSHSKGVSITGPVLGGVVLVLLALFATPLVQRSSRRRRRLGLGRRGDADALWAELSDTATDLGYVWSPARSPRQVAAWLGPDAGSANPQLTELAAAVEKARYAPPGAAAVDGPALVADFDRLRAQLASTRERRQRMRARLLPASLGWTTHAPRWLTRIPGIGSAVQPRRH